MFLAAETSCRLYLPLIVSSHFNDLYQETVLNFQLKSCSESGLGTWRYLFSCCDCSDSGFVFPSAFAALHSPSPSGLISLGSEGSRPPCSAAPVGGAAGCRGLHGCGSDAGRLLWLLLAPRGSLPPYRCTSRAPKRAFPSSRQGGTHWQQLRGHLNY